MDCKMFPIFRCFSGAVALPYTILFVVYRYANALKSPHIFSQEGGSSEHHFTAYIITIFYNGIILNLFGSCGNNPLATWCFLFQKASSNPIMRPYCCKHFISSLSWPPTALLVHVVKSSIQQDIL